MATCAQKLPMKMELIGMVTLVQNPGISIPGVPVPVGGPPSSSVLDPNNLLPPDATRVVPVGFDGSVPLCRVTSYNFDSQVTECVSILEYEFCQYKQSYDLTVAGTSIYSSPPSNVLFRDAGEIVDVCYIKIIEEVVRFGLGAIPNPFAFIGLNAVDTDASQAKAAFERMLGVPSRREFGMVAPTRISASAVQRIVDLAALGAPQSERPQAADLPSLIVGSAEISDVIADLGTTDNPTVRLLVAALQQASQPIRIGEGVTSDDAFIGVAGIALADLRRTVLQGAS